MKKIFLFSLPLFAAGFGIGGGYVARAIFSGQEIASKGGKEIEKNTDGSHDTGNDKKKITGDKKKDPHGGKKAADREKASSKEKKSTDKKDSYGQSNYMKFSRQFVVPLIENEKVVSMMIFDINLVMNSDADSDFYIHEPKARDALMSGLLSLAQQGVFSGDIGADRHVGYVKSRLLDNVQSALGRGVDEVLILDMVRQDM